MARMANSLAAPAVVTRALMSLVCDCGEPATQIHIVDANAAHRPPRPVDEPHRLWEAYPAGEMSVARPVCDRHTHRGYSFTIAWALQEWHGWFDHLASKGVGADEALRRLVRSAR